MNATESGEEARRPPEDSSIAPPPSGLSPGPLTAPGDACRARAISKPAVLTVTATENLDGSRFGRDRNASSVAIEDRICGYGCARCVGSFGRCLDCEVDFVWVESQQRCIFNFDRRNLTSPPPPPPSMAPPLSGKSVRRCDVGDSNVSLSLPFVLLVLLPFALAACWPRNPPSTDVDAGAAGGGRHVSIVILNADTNDVTTSLPAASNLAQQTLSEASPDTVVVMGPSGSVDVGIPEADAVKGCSGEK